MFEFYPWIKETKPIVLLYLKTKFCDWKISTDLYMKKADRHQYLRNGLSHNLLCLSRCYNLKGCVLRKMTCRSTYVKWDYGLRKELFQTKFSKKSFFDWEKNNKTKIKGVAFVIRYHSTFNNNKEYPRT